MRKAPAFRRTWVAPATQVMIILTQPELPLAEADEIIKTALAATKTPAPLSFEELGRISVSDGEASAKPATLAKLVDNETSDLFA